MSLDDLMAAHARGLLIDGAHSGELVTRTRAGEALTIHATIDRVGRVLDEQTGGLSLWRAVLFVAKHATSGVLDTRAGDTWTFPKVKGGAVLVTCRAIRARVEDAAAFEIEVEQ